MLSMNAYSKDLRLKTLAAIDRGIPRKEVAELFGVSRSTIKRWLKRRRQTGGVETMKIPGRPSVKGEALREWLPSQLKSNPDLTLREHCEAFEDESGVEVSGSQGSESLRPSAQEQGQEPDAYRLDESARNGRVDVR